VGILMISSPEDRKKVAKAIKEISDSMTRIDAEKDLIKDIIQVTFENHQIDKKHIRKLASIYHKQNMSEVKYEYDEVETLYEELFREN
jgi:predicted RNA binding protein with dsRBD fold (UPF0201 family)